VTTERSLIGDAAKAAIFTLGLVLILELADSEPTHDVVHGLDRIREMSFATIAMVRRAWRRLLYMLQIEDYVAAERDNLITAAEAIKDGRV
jgi:hypothetical protein